MAYAFGDSFDLYAAQADLALGYWDSVTGTVNPTATGRFTGSRGLNMSSTGTLTKISNVNDGIHHCAFSFSQGQPISGTSLWQSFQFFDGATAQCSVVFRSDGAILLTSGGPGGAVLATYTSAFTATNTWYAFEFEIVIHNTNGSFRVRKNGNTSDDFVATSLNTRPTSTNNYANKLVLGQGGNTVQTIDDLFWKSDATLVAWMGDIRCYTRMPVSDVQAQFSKFPTNFFAQTTGNVVAGSAMGAGVIRSTQVTCPAYGTLVSLSFNFSAGITGHAKMAIYDSTGAAGGAGALIAQTSELTNPGAGVNVFPIVGSPTVSRGALYWISLWSDVAITGIGTAGGLGVDLLTLAYTTSFPATMAGFTTLGSLAGFGSNGMNVNPFNASCVTEPQQDAGTTYVYDSNPGDNDLYALAPLSVTPVAIISVVTRALMQKSDVGSRTANVQLKSGSTIVNGNTVVLTTSGWLWSWRSDLVDPATSAAWVPASVNALQIGPVAVT